MQKIMVSFLLISFLAQYSCRKSDRDDDKTTNTSQDYAMVQSMALNVNKIIHQAALSSQGISANNLTTATTIFGCDTLIVDTVSSPMSIIVQFTDCSVSGIVRNGKIKATFSSKYDMAGANVNISFIDYTHNGMPVSGAIKVVNTGINNGNPTYNFSTNELKVEEGWKNRAIYWNANQSLTQTSGETTADFLDDSYTVTGISNGRTYAGNAFTTNTEGLNFLGNCNWVSSGIATVSPANLAVRTLDFGSGCDNNAVVTLFEKQHEIAFP